MQNYNQLKYDLNSKGYTYLLGLGMSVIFTIKVCPYEA